MARRDVAKDESTAMNRAFNDLAPSHRLERFHFGFAVGMPGNAGRNHQAPGKRKVGTVKSPDAAMCFAAQC
jgi:hypothetical protein